MLGVILTVVMLSLTNLSDVLLNVVMLNVAAATWLSCLHILSTAGQYSLIITLLPLSFSRKQLHSSHYKMPGLKRKCLCFKFFCLCVSMRMYARERERERKKSNEGVPTSSA
jgi:hypothetical protein